MKRWLFALLFPVLTLFPAGCHNPYAKYSSEDIEIDRKFAREINILKRPDLPPNSELKYRAAKVLADHIDFTFTNDVEVLDRIFGTRDLRVDDRKAAVQTLMYYYRYQDRSIRFVFVRNGRFVLRCEVTEK